MNELKVDCLVETRGICGEGCVWHPDLDAVFWTDINLGLLHCYSLRRATLETWQFDQPVTAVVLTDRPDTIALVLGGSIVLWNTQSCQVIDTLYQLDEWPEVRCNDARVDPSGVLWFGTMQNNVKSDGTKGTVTERRGNLYSLVPKVKATLWCSGLGIVNTLAWSPDSRVMYFGDTLDNCIYRSEFDLAKKELKHRTPFFQGFDRGLPDGSSVDSDGFLWNCRYGGGCIVRIAPDGLIAATYEMPVLNPTTCAFGGSDLKTLFVTSAAAGTDSRCSLSSIAMPVRGLSTVPLRTI